MNLIKSKLLTDEKEIIHCFTTKDDSMPYQGSMALHTGEDSETIKQNRDSFKSLFPKGSSFVSVLQVHGSNIIDIKERRDIGWDRLDRAIQADALVTATPSVVLTILTADCVPILLFDKKKRVISAVHAGWRGTADNIIVKTLEYMKKSYHSNPIDIIASIGPAIGECCYEVDSSVASKFKRYPQFTIAKADDKFMLDLKGINREQMIEFGVTDSNIETINLCTSCENSKLFSYRKECGCTGRFISAIMLKDTI